MVIGGRCGGRWGGVVIGGWCGDRWKCGDRWGVW